MIKNQGTLGIPETQKLIMVEHQLMVMWVIRSIPHGGPTELFLIPASVPQLV